MEEIIRQYGAVLLTMAVAACIIVLFCSTAYGTGQDYNLMDIIGKKLMEGGL
ncbi:MAG: hypothetical protein RR364_03395 [Lachnospiraceae bacterium]